MSAVTPASGGPGIASDPLIELTDVSKHYYRGGGVVEALTRVNLVIHPGEYVAVMGASGSGKTTLMNLLGCLDRPTTGSYRFAGHEVGRLSADQQAVLRREAFGFIFQQYHLLATANAAENVEIPAVYAGVPKGERLERARRLLTSLGLADRVEHRPSELSGGQQQRVSIARALMNGGKVILADEPTGALDSRNGAEVLRLIDDLNAAGHTVVLITHDPTIARRAGRIIELKDGVVVRDTGEAPRREPSPEQDAAPLRRRRGGLPVLFDVMAAARMAGRSLRVNAFRTALTLLGIVIGVSSVVGLVAVADGTKRQIVQNITSMGSNLLLVRPGARNVRHSSAGVATLVVEDAEAIARLPGVVAVLPELTDQVTVRYGNSDYATSSDSTSAALPRVRAWPVASGSFFTGSDVTRYAAVAVLGQTVAHNLFPQGGEIVGRYVLLNNVPFQVVGVMSAKGATPSGSDQDDVVFVPATTGTLRLHGLRYVKSITVQVRDMGQIDAVQERVNALLTKRHGAEDFQIRNMATLLETVTETANTLTLLLAAIAAISLVVGGIGVMNIMLVSVTERTREIGIRMATGARRINIMLQFSTEALVVCAIGGVVGVAAGIGLAWLLAALGQPVVVTVWPVAAAFGSAFLTGLVLGYLPARKAALMDPVVALGVE